MVSELYEKITETWTGRSNRKHGRELHNFL